jgi:hypothetical protein
VVTELAKQGASISPEEALTWVRAELLQRHRVKTNGAAPASNPLAALAEQAVAFVEKLKASDQLVSQPGTAEEQFETDVVAACSVTEAPKQDLRASKAEIA